MPRAHRAACLSAVLLIAPAAPAPALSAADVDAAALRAMRGLRRVTSTLASDRLRGRDNDTPESIAAQRYLLPRLRRVGRPSNPAASGYDAYRQPFESNGQRGANLLAVIPGRELPDEHVVLGAHYDHLGTRSAPNGTCSATGPTGGEVCNGATDNATSVAVVLAVGRAVRSLPTPPRRSIVLALWDAEEDSLLGSRYYVDHPIVPLAQTTTYVNLDVLGATLLPSLHATTFAVGSETGGAVLRGIVDDAFGAQSIDVRPFSFIFGQLRSDYANFGARGVPTVFFSDSTGGCYHATGDDVRVVDFGKLAQQSAVVLRTVVGLAEAPERPVFVAPNPALAVFEDAQSLQHVLANVVPADLSLFDAAQQAQIESTKVVADQIVAAGAGQFDNADIITILQSAVALSDLLAQSGCRAF